MKKILALTLSLGLLNPLWAGSVNNTIQSKAVLSAACTISATDVVFGVVNPGVTNYATGQLSVFCSQNAPYSVGMNYPYHGQGNTGGIYFSGKLLGAKTGNTDSFNYNVYYPGSNTVLWGSGNASASGATSGYGVSVVTGTGTGAMQTYPIRTVASTFSSTTGSLA